MASIYRISSGWRAQVRVKNMTPVSQVFKTQREAKEWAREQEGKVSQSANLTGENLTVSDVIETYKSNVPRICQSKETAFRVLDYYLGSAKVRDLTTKRVVEYAKTRRSEKFPNGRKQGRPGLPGPATVLQDLIYLKTVLKHGGAMLDATGATHAAAVVERAMLTLRHADMIDDSERRERRPTEEELRAIDITLASRPRAASSVPTFDVVMFSICTCLRLGEIVGSGGVTWEDLDLAGRTLVVRKRKDPTTYQGRDDCIPLLVGHVTYGGNVVDPIDIILHQKTAKWRKGRIFPFAESTIGVNFANAVLDSGIVNLTFHDLRHDGISRMFEADYDIPQVASVSGHKSWKNLQRYTHLRPSSVQRNKPITIA